MYNDITLDSIRKVIQNKVYYNIYDVKKHLIIDYDEVISKIKKLGINYKNLISDYIDTYTLVLLIICSESSITLKYKKYIIFCVLEKLSEIKNPTLGIDRLNTICFKKNTCNKFSFKTKNELSSVVRKEKQFSDVLNEEIDLSCNMELIRQLF